MKKILTLSCLVLLACLSTARADTTFKINALLAEAEPDECFAGVGENYPNGITGYNPNAGPPCPAFVTLASGVTATVTEKYNQTYVWSLTRPGNSLWFGTGGNIYCTTEGDFLGTLDPSQISTGVCEFGNSQLVRTGIVGSASRGDFRPARIFEFALATNVTGTPTGTLIERTPNDPLIRQTLGFRSAGSFNGVVFFAEASRFANVGVNMFAFDANTKEYLGSHTFTQYGTATGVSIRKWLVVKNHLYTAIGTDGGSGYILRWTGSRSNLWSFAIVGRIVGLPRELAEYTDSAGRTRIAVTAQGLWLSPPIYYSQGLLTSQAYGWKEIWDAWDYDPDFITASAYAGGALHYFDGWLYWGTMNMPTRAAYLHKTCPYGSSSTCFGEPQTPEEEDMLSHGTARAISIWRGRNLESTRPEIQLLYGESELPVYSAATRSFDLRPTGYTPLYGHSGFEDPAEGIKPNKNNAYTWTMEVANGKLFVGTFDLGGADLWRFDSSSLPAKREDKYGLNTTRENYGIRTMETSADGKTLYCGMATYSNLVSTTSTTPNTPGWELRALTFE